MFRAKTYLILQLTKPKRTLRALYMSLIKIALSQTLLIITSKALILTVSFSFESLRSNLSIFKAKSSMPSLFSQILRLRASSFLTLSQREKILPRLDLAFFFLINSSMTPLHFGQSFVGIWSVSRTIIQMAEIMDLVYFLSLIHI